ncbi:hypothetical protein SK128_024845, partial [Halocaridina rubra]
GTRCVRPTPWKEKKSVECFFFTINRNIPLSFYDGVTASPLSLWIFLLFASDDS